jgi:DNA-binding transcriptional regulator YiaG
MSMSAADGVGYVPFLTAARLSLRCERERPKPRPLERVGDHVRERRTELGLTQAQAAARIGICRDALARWEVRPMMPDVHTMPAVIAFLGYNPLPSAHTFQELLLRTRRTLGLDQASLADVLSVPFNTLHSWERGLFAPCAERMAQVEARIAALG